MKRTVRYMLIAVIALVLFGGTMGMSAKAAETGSGTLGTADGVQWSYDESAKTLTITGEDTGLDAGEYQSGYIYGICDDVEKIVLQDFKPIGSVRNLFRNLKSLQSIEIDSVDTSEVTDMSYMFYGCSNLSELDLQSFDTACVTDMSYMFYGCKKLAKLNVTGFFTENVESMKYMFCGCTKLTELDLSSFVTDKLIYTLGMFSGCNNLKSVDLSHFNTSQVLDMACMFYECRALEGLDLSSFDTRNVTDMSYMFYGCTKLPRLNLSSFSTPRVKSMKSMFQDCTALAEVDLSNFDTSKVSNYYTMFKGCSSLLSLDLSAFATPKATQVYAMFEGCRRLKSLTFGDFDLSNVTSTEAMFKDCSGLESLNLSGLDTSKVTTMRNMFSGCKSLKSLNLSGFATDSVTDMYCLFKDCNSLTSLDVSSFNTAQVGTMYNMFKGCGSLGSLDVSSFDTAKVADMYGMFTDCSSLTQLDLSNFNTGSVTDMASMFDGCDGLTQLNISSFDTAKVTDMNSMFKGCSGLTVLEVESFVTDAVTDMSFMFNDCSSLTELQLSGFGGESLQDVSSMFAGCTGLQSIDLNNLTTANVVYMQSMFGNCSGLIDLDLSGFDISRSDDVQGMLTGATGLQRLKAPETMAEGQKVELSLELRDHKGRPVIELNKDLCGTVLYKNYLEITTDRARIPINTEVQLKLKLNGNEVGEYQYKKYQWSSTDEDVVTVSDGGKVKAVDFGTATITCTRDSLNVASYEITVVEKFEIIRQPESKTVMEGESVTFAVEVTGDGLTYQWQFRTSPNGGWSNLENEGANTGSITIPDVAGKNNYEYQCVITDGNNDTKTSNIAKLTVKEMIITSHPVDADITEGEDAVFEIATVGNNISYQWQYKKPNENNWNNVSTPDGKSERIVVQGTMDKNGYQYRCVVKKQKGFWQTEEQHSKIVTLKVTHKIIITEQPAEQNVYENANAIFKVNATGDGLTYQWQFKKSATGDWMISGITGANTNSITVQGTATRNGYRYRCVITDRNGKTLTSNEASLTVVAMFAITKQPASQSIAEGENATFEMDAMGSGLTYQWQLKKPGTDSWIDSGTEGANTNSITVRGMAPRNGYQYRCVITDKEGKVLTSDPASLTVIKFAITKQPASQSVVVGESATFEVSATGSGLTYQWQLKKPGADVWMDSGMEGARNDSITVQGTTERNGYQYRCLVTDVTGKTLTGNAATLTVVKVFVITEQPASKSVTIGENVVFKVSATGSGLTYQWQLKKPGADVWMDSGMTGVKTNNITVQGTTARDGYQNRCVVTDVTGKAIISDIATLTITKQLAIVGQPVSKSVAVGADAIFKVSVTGSGLTYQWQLKKPGADIWMDSGMTGSKTNSITVQGTVARNGYQYRCVITDGNGQKITSAGAILTVN